MEVNYPPRNAKPLNLGEGLVTVSSIVNPIDESNVDREFKYPAGDHRQSLKVRRVTEPNERTDVRKRAEICGDDGELARRMIFLCLDSTADVLKIELLEKNQRIMKPPHHLEPHIDIGHANSGPSSFCYGSPRSSRDNLHAAGANSSSSYTSS